MPEHPIQGLMRTAMEHIRDMVSANTIVGAPVVAQNGTTVLPICRVSFGFAAGGGEFVNADGQSGQSGQSGNPSDNTAVYQPQQPPYPFGGGSGAGVSITPIAFLVVGADGVNVLPLGQQAHVITRLLDAVPAAFDRIQAMFRKNAEPDRLRKDRADGTGSREYREPGEVSRTSGPHGQSPDQDRMMREI
ncbi:MAG: sporulation protein YtfJ [Candidatus Reconcilbacillus cellulovorans]|uniref:Sporulation protein YtfJ n=1 Tax=Candidatus Reconcilbacillus cellulovorans TaxID=1906605 RepID=A0A2A6DZI7_9BACL|nr:MAG: sporulation protein YtfJ [Candidatus Reconcilbacillus cellulovorans]